MKEISKKEFDELVNKGEFIEGPMIDTFGDNYGEPYVPDRKAIGTLKNNEKVWAWVRGSKSEEK